MNNAIVLFATKYGSTQQIAEDLALHLESRCENVTHITDPAMLDRYDTLILGAPIYNNDIHPDMQQFLKSHFIGVNERSIVTFVVDGITDPDPASTIGIDYRPLIAKYLSTAPLLMLRFTGRLTKSAAGADDYQWMEQFYRNELGTELRDFDYYEHKTIEEATEIIQAAIDDNTIACASK